jgi:xylulokinase
MSKELLLGIDVGTTACKVGLFNLSGKLLSTSTAEYPTNRPRGGWAEQNPEDWWSAFQQSFKSAVKTSGVDPGRVVGVGVSNMSTTVLPIDDRGLPLRSAIIWPDTRSTEECQWLRRNIGQETFSAISHNVIGTFCGLPKLLWFKNHQPELFTQTASFVQAGAYIVLKLTGCFSMNLSDIEMTGLGDANARNWSFELAEKVGIPPKKLPPINKCYEVVGEVTTEVANLLGLIKGTPVVAGSTDIAAAALVAGIKTPGQAFIDAGHATNLAVCIDKPMYHKGLIFFGSVDPDLWLIEGASGYTGASMRWLRDTLFEFSNNNIKDETQVYELMDRMAKESTPGAGGVIFIPYLNGALCPLWDTNARGMLFGLSLSTRRSDLVQAVMEGCSFDLKFNLEVIESLGADVSEMVITGGGSKSMPWNQARADITQKSIKVVTDSGGSVLGAALLSGVGAGFYQDTKVAANRIQQSGQKYLPRSELALIYQKFYRIYRALYENTKAESADIQKALSGIGQ